MCILWLWRLVGLLRWRVLLLLLLIPLLEVGRRRRVLLVALRWISWLLVWASGSRRRRKLAVVVVGCLALICHGYEALSSM